MTAPLIETDHDHGPPRVISVYFDGLYAGYIGVAKNIRAVSAEGIEIGTFPSVAEAKRAVVQEAGCR